MPDIQETTERKAEIGIGEMYEVLRKRTDDYVRRYRRDFVVFLVVYVLSVAAICAVAYSLIHGAQSAAEGQAVAPALQEHDFIKLFTPIAVLVFGFVITMLGLKRFEQIDDQIRLIRNELIDTLRDGRNDMEAWLKHQLDSTQVSLRNDAEKALKNIEELRENAINEINGKNTGWKDKFDKQIEEIREHIKPFEFLFAKTEYNIPSVESAHTLATQLFLDGKTGEAMSICKYAVERKLPGDPDDYHNLASELARRDQLPLAIQVIDLGLESYQNNVDLLADGVRFNAALGRFERAETLKAQLEEIDKNLWNWRAVVFVGDYLGLRGRFNEANELYDEFMQIIPDDERFYSQKAGQLMRRGKYREATEVLGDALRKIARAPQCALRLSECHLALGNYDKAVQAADKALETNTSEQPDVNRSVVFWRRAAAQDAWICRDMAGKTELDEAMVERIRRCAEDYRTALSMNDCLFVFQNSGRERLKVLLNLLVRNGMDRERAKQIIGEAPLGISDGLLDAVLRQKLMENEDADSADKLDGDEVDT